MRNLFSFIARHYFFFLFLALQVVSFALIFNNQFYQRSAFINSSNLIAGNIYNLRNNVVSYFNLKKENQQIAEYNNLLLSSTPGSYIRTDQQVFTLQDTTYHRKFTYINARVIKNSVRNRNNYLTLNKGRQHGIKPDMGVITPQGVIGIVKNVSQNFSSVISFLHTDIQVSVSLAKDNQLGTLIWNGYNYRKATMLYIPPHVELTVGDTIFTSGYSQIFPEGIFLGTIAGYEIRRGDNFFTIDVDLAVDFNNLTYVNVVNNLFAKELEQLAETELLN